MNDGNVDAPMLSPAETNSVFGFSARFVSTAPARLAAPTSPLPPRPEASMRPWKSLIVRMSISAFRSSTSKSVVVPETSLPTATSGRPVADFSAGMNATPSAPWSPEAGVPGA